MVVSQLSNSTHEAMFAGSASHVAMQPRALSVNNASLTHPGSNPGQRSCSSPQPYVYEHRVLQSNRVPAPVEVAVVVSVPVPAVVIVSVVVDVSVCVEPLVWVFVGAKPHVPLSRAAIHAVHKAHTPSINRIVQSQAQPHHSERTAAAPRVDPQRLEIIARNHDRASEV